MENAPSDLATGRRLFEVTKKLCPDFVNRTNELIQKVSNQMKKISTLMNHSKEELCFSLIAELTEKDERLTVLLTKLRNTVGTRFPFEGGLAAHCYGDRQIIGPKRNQEMPTELKTQEKSSEKSQESSSSRRSREIIGDGNCFVSSFAARFLEELMQKPTSAIEQFKRFIMDAEIAGDTAQSMDLKFVCIETINNL